MSDSSELSPRVEKDIEAGEKSPGVVDNEYNHDSPVRGGSVTPAYEIARARHIQNAVAPFRWLSQGEAWLDAKLGVETQGIDRVPEEKKKPPSIWNVFFMWWGMVCHIGTVPIGVLGPVYGLNLTQSIVGIFVGTFIGALLPAYCGTLGPKTGLRAIATSRYSFGFYGAKLCSILNIIVSGGFAVVNIVTTGQMLSAVSNYTMTISVGCIIVAIISYAVSVFGFAWIHVYEKYSWPISFILLCVLIGQAGPHIDSSLPGLESGFAFSGVFLSFLCLTFSSASGWCSLAADYYVHYPANTKSWKIFTLTLFGLGLPCFFATTCGAIIANAAILGQVQPWADAYTNHGFGGLLLETYHPLGWSKTCLVLLTFSVLGNNIAIFYSTGLSLQLLGHHFHAVPRFVWSFVVAVVITVLAIAGKTHLSNIISDFVSMLGYWTVSFTLILLIEDQWFRRRTGYNLTVWDMADKLPWGAAAVLALLCGYLGGGVPGMVQVWFIGPIAAKFGPAGGDVGIYLSAAITCLVYPIARHFEIKWTGR